MRGFLAVARREIAERRSVWPAAAVLSLLPFLGHNPENFPYILQGLKVVATVAQHVHHPHNSPSL